MIEIKVQNVEGDFEASIDAKATGNDQSFDEAGLLVAYLAGSIVEQSMKKTDHEKTRREATIEALHALKRITEEAYCWLPDVVGKILD